MGVISKFALVHSEAVGRDPESIDWLKIVVRAGASSTANSFSIQHEILSGAKALFGSGLASNFSTPVVVISRFAMGRLFEYMHSTHCCHFHRRNPYIFCVLLRHTDAQRSKFTVGELRSGVTGFATIFATGSHRFLLQVRNDGRGGINHRQIKMVNLTYHWHVYVIISPWNIIELCRTFRRDITAKKQQLVTLKVKNLRNNRQKINNFEFWRQLTTMMGMWLQAFILTVI